MTFLTMRVKVKTVYRFKRPYISMDNGDNFMKFAGKLLNTSWIKCVYLLNFDTDCGSFVCLFVCLIQLCWDRFPGLNQY